MVIQLLVSGLLLGGIYALISVGLSLILGVSKFVNFAHGDFVMIGMYMTFAAFSFSGISPYFLWPVVLVGAVIFGFFIFMLVKLTIGKPGTSQILLTLGLSMVLQNVILIIFKSDFRAIPQTIGKNINVFNIFLSTEQIIAFLLSILLTFAFLYFISKTDTGRAMRAVGENREASKLMGINVEKIDLLTFCLGTVMACLAGTLLMTMYPTTPTAGSGYNLIAWVIVVLGGVGNLKGALVSALFIGVVEVFTGFYIGADLRQAAYYLVFIIVLVFRPQGIFTGVFTKKEKKA